MRVAKSAYLKRLLSVQDVLIGVWVYLLSVQAILLIDMPSPSWDPGFMEARLALVVFAASIVALINNHCGIQEITVRAMVLYAARFTTVVLAILWLFNYTAHQQSYPTGVLAVFGAALFTTLLVNRLFLRWWYVQERREHPENYLKVVVVGTGPRAQRFVDDYQKGVDWKVHIVAMVELSATIEADCVPPCPDTDELDDIPILRGIDAIRELLVSQVIDEIVVCLPRSKINDIETLVEQCDEQAICLRFMADLYDLPSNRMTLDAVGRIPLLTIEPVKQNHMNLLYKRMFDIVVSTAALIVLSPILLLVAGLIKLDSRGPVIFSQQRVGLNKRRFNMLKFRSMHTNAEAALAELEHLNEAEGPIFKMDNDPRVTRIGHWLRRSSIDELPQLFNVVMGQMSIIGPRPMSVRDVEGFSTTIQRRRFSVRPGLACLREVSGRSKLSFEQWLEMDLEYIQTWSFSLDLKILLALIPAVIRGDGAS